MVLCHSSSSKLIQPCRVVRMDFPLHGPARGIRCCLDIPKEADVLRGDPAHFRGVFTCWEVLPSVQMTPDSLSIFPQP